MAYDAGSIFARIYARFDESGFDRFDRRVSKARSDSARPIDAKLGADYRPQRLQAFERDLSGARRAAARPITAHAKVEYDPGPLRRFVLALGGAGGGINRFRRTLGDADDGMGSFNRRMLMMRNAGRLVAFPAAIASLGALGGALNGVVAIATAAVSTLSQLAGAAVLMPAAFVSMAQGFGATALAAVGLGDALGAMSDQQSGAAQTAADSAQQQQRAADTIADARRGVADANREELQAQRNLRVAWRQAARDLRDLQDAAVEAALAQRRAVLDLEGVARQGLELALEGHRPGSYAQRVNDLAYASATQDVVRATEERRRATDDLRHAMAAGLRGSDAVVQATERLQAAQRGTADAVRSLQRSLRDARQDMAAGTSASNKLAEAMNKLPPAAQRFARFLFGLKPRMDDLRNTAAAGLFPGVETGIRRAMRNFPALDRVVGATARTLGRLAEQAGAFAGSKAFGRDFERIASTNNRLIGNMGRGSINLASAMRHVLVAAGPFIRWFGDATERFTNFIDRQAQAGRESGRLAAFFDRLKTTMQLVGRTLGNLGLALVRIGGIANRELGQHMLRGLDRASASLERWTRSTRGQNQIARYFRDARPVADEFGRLIRDITVGLLKLGSGEQTAGLVRSLRTELLPVLLDLFTAANRHLMPALIDGFVAVARVLRDLAPALGATLRALSGMVRLVAWLIENIPGIKLFVGALIAMRGLYLALRIAATISGLNTIVALLKQIGVLGAASGAAGAAGGAAGAAGGAAGGAAAGGGLAGLARRIGPARLIGGGVAIAGVQLVSAADVGKIKDVRSGLESWGRAAFQSLKIINPGVRAAAFAAEKFNVNLGGARRELGLVRGAAGQTGESIRRAFGPIPSQVAAGARAMEKTGVRGARTLARALAQIPAVKRLRFFMADKDVRRRLSTLSDLVKRLVGEKWVVRVLTNAPNAAAAVRAFRAILRGVPPEKVVKILQNAPNARTAVRRLNDAIKGVPKERRITFSTPGLQAVLNRIDKLRRWVDDLRAQGAVVPFTGAGQVVPRPSQIGRQRGGTKRLTLDDLEEMKRQKGNRGGKAGPGAGKGGPQVVVYGEGNKQEWWISQEGDKRQNVAWAVEALEKLTGKRVTLAKTGAGGFSSGSVGVKRGGKPLTDPVTGQQITAKTKRAAQQIAAKPYAEFGKGNVGYLSGSRTLGRLRHVLAGLKPLRKEAQTAERQYLQLERHQAVTDEVLTHEDEDGNIIVNQEAVNTRLREIEALKAKAQQIRDIYLTLKARVVAAREAVTRVATHLQNIIKTLKSPATRIMKGKYIAERRALLDLIPSFHAEEEEAGLDATDWQTAMDELDADWTTVNSTKGSLAKPIGGTGSSAPSPEDIARGAFAQYESFQFARASLARDFGSNFMRTGGTMPGGSANEYYPRYWGTSGAEQGSGGGQTRTEITVNNNYASGPGDPHTWSQDQKWQLSTMGI